jgi:phosphohistidine phosphatase
MKTLTLLRHAKSTWNDPVAIDFDRPLNKKGRRAAHTIGRALKDEGLRFDRVLASPALRVIETLDDVADGYGSKLDRQYDKRIYLASPAVLLDVIHEADDEADRIMIVGHNPGLERLALMLTDGEGLRSEVAVKYPTATVAEISLPVQHWRDVSEGIGTLIRFIRPRDLDPTLGPDQDTH